MRAQQEVCSYDAAIAQEDLSVLQRNSVIFAETCEENPLFHGPFQQPLLYCVFFRCVLLRGLYLRDIDGGS